MRNPICPDCKEEMEKKTKMMEIDADIYIYECVLCGKKTAYEIPVAKVISLD